MVWKGEELRSPMDYFAAMSAVRDPDEAREFLETPLNFDELLTLGMEFQKAQINGDDFEAAGVKAREGVRALRRLREATRG
jgi:hypothetical protein